MSAKEAATTIEMVSEAMIVSVLTVVSVNARKETETGRGAADGPTTDTAKNHEGKRNEGAGKFLCMATK